MQLINFLISTGFIAAVAAAPSKLPRAEVGSGWRIAKDNECMECLGMHCGDLVCMTHLLIVVRLRKRYLGRRLGGYMEQWTMCLR